MKTRLLINLYLSLLVIATYSCSKSDLDVAGQGNGEIAKDGSISIENQNPVLDLMLKASNDKGIVKAMHSEALSSLEVGLEESVYFNDILSNDAATRVVSEKSVLKSFIHSNLSLNGSALRAANSNDVFKIDDVEIYWPYSEDWDGISQPVIVLNNSDGTQYIEEDKTYAYKFTKDGGHYVIDTLIVDENYAENNPVWVVNKNHVSLQDIINLKSGNFASTKYIPRQETNTLTRSAEPGSYVSTLMIKSIQSTQQHDDWLNGGSEYIIYWGFPANEIFKLGEHHTGQIHFSRKEIKKRTTKTINFTGNYDWDKTQTHNKIKVIEFDPGKNVKFTFSLKGKYKAVEGEFKTEITLNNNDDFIMEYLVPRKAYMKKENQVSTYLFKNKFEGSGVTVITNLYAEETVEPF